MKKVSVRSAWEKNKSVSYEQCKPAYVPPQGNDFEYTAKIRTLAETERFFDELTKEKDQVKTNIKKCLKSLSALNVTSEEESGGNY